MDAWLSLDFVAKRYGVLPSVALATGYDTDIICANIAIGYENYLNRAQENGTDPTTPELTQEEMLEMIKRARNDTNSIKKESNST